MKTYYVCNTNGKFYIADFLPSDPEVTIYGQFDNEDDAADCIEGLLA
jgi:hypothetical protein